MTLKKRKYNILQNKFQREVLDKVIKSDHVFGLYFGPKNRKHTSLRLCSCNHHYEKSDYFYSGHLEFIHFTSQNKLKSIIKSKHLRLFNLSGQNDEEEFKFAARVLGIRDKYHEISRRRIYSLSMCNVDILNDLTMWRLYGENTKGIGLKLKITNDPIQWMKFHLSKIYYGEIEKLKQYKEEKSKFEKEHDFEFLLNLDRFLAFHKSKHYEIEKEVRLIHFAEPNRRPFEIRPEPLKVYELGSFIKIDLDNNFKSDSDSKEFDLTKPKIEISEIILGPNFNNQELIEFIKDEMPDVLISNSNLKNIYKV